MVTENSRWLKATIAFALTATAAFSVFIFRKKSRSLDLRFRELEISLKAALKNCVAERQGRIRAQQALRKALVEQNSEKSKPNSYPMTPIATVQSCFSTRNGTPRQPLLVPLARACLVLDSSRVPPEALEGFTEYSHCWILYVFHLNTDLDKLWKQPSRSKLKAKVRVPRLKGGKMGVLATRSPHRPCPIGLTVAKVEAVSGRIVLLSGVDLVDGTPVLDIKPYLPSDSIEGARVPKWLSEDNPLIVASINFSPGFSSTLNTGWQIAQKRSLYASPDEFKSLINQVLSWDIRSVSQRKYPHNTPSKKEGQGRDDLMMCSEGDDTDTESDSISNRGLDPGDITFRVILEGVEVSYSIDRSSNVIVEKATFSSHIEDNAGNHCNYIMWSDILARK